LKSSFARCSLTEEAQRTIQGDKMPSLKLLSHAVLPSLPSADVTIYADHHCRDTDFHIIIRVDDSSPVLQGELQRMVVFPLGMHRVCLSVLSGPEEPLPSDKIMQFLAQQRASIQPKKKR
jgi:hypothetical protein